MTIAIVLRDAAPDEAAYLSDLAKRSKAHWGYSDDFMADCEAELTYSAQQLQDSQFDFVVLENDTAVVGFYAIKRLENGVFELEAMFVEPRYIGTGIGRQLIEHALSKVAILGGESLVIQGDPNAVAFYEAAGGERIGSRESGSVSGRMLPVFRIAIRNLL